MSARCLLDVYLSLILLVSSIFLLIFCLILGSIVSGVLQSPAIIELSVSLIRDPVL